MLSAMINFVDFVALTRGRIWNWEVIFEIVHKLGNFIFNLLVSYRRSMRTDIIRQSVQLESWKRTDSHGIQRLHRDHPEANRKSMDHGNQWKSRRLCHHRFWGLSVWNSKVDGDWAWSVWEWFKAFEHQCLLGFWIQLRRWILHSDWDEVQRAIGLSG